MEKAIMKPATFPYMYQYRGGKKKKKVDALKTTWQIN